MEMSHARISSGVGVRPTPYRADWASAAAPISNTKVRILSVPIGHAPIARDFPRLNGVVEAGHAEGFVKRLVPELGDLFSRWLHLTDVVRAARLDLGLLSVPIPLIPESGVRHARRRSLDLGGVPALAAVRRDLHLLDRAAT